jgi:hypothetical protein
MRKILGALIFVLSVFLAIYIGFYIIFMGGLAFLIEGVQANPANPLTAALGLVIMSVAGPIGWGIFLLGSALSGTIFYNE